MEFKPSSEIEQFIESKVRSGQYQSAEEVINAAIGMLRDQDELGSADLDLLRGEVEKGLQQSRAGKSKPLDMGAIRAEIRRRHEQRKTA